MKKAVCLLLCKNDLVLGVCRRGTSNDWNIPGGKVEDNETDKEALVREVFEETNLILNKNDLVFIYNRIDGEFIVNTYLYYGSYTESQLAIGDAGNVSFITWNKLLQGTFGEYNKNLLNKIQGV